MGVGRGTWMAVVLCALGLTGCPDDEIDDCTAADQLCMDDTFTCDDECVVSCIANAGACLLAECTASCSDAGPAPTDAGDGMTDAGDGMTDAGDGMTDAGGGMTDAGPGGGLSLCETGTCTNARDCPATPPMVGASCVPFAGRCHYCMDGMTDNVVRYSCTKLEPYSEMTVSCL